MCLSMQKYTVLQNHHRKLSERNHTKPSWLITYLNNNNAKSKCLLTYLNNYHTKSRWLLTDLTK